MDEEREKERRTYSLCRLGFILLSAALIPASLTSIVGSAYWFLTIFFHAGHVLGPLIRSSEYQWFEHWIGVPIVWLSLIGTYLLWGRWNDASWQRRAGLLVLMGTIDVVLDLLEHGNDIGFRLSEIGHPWLRHHIGRALGWAEFALMASLACDLMTHFGVERVQEAGRATRSLAATGAIVWLLSFCERTDWHKWPLDKNPNPASLEGVLLFLGSEFIWTVALVQVTALSIAAAREATKVLNDLNRDDIGHELLKSPSESDPDFLPADDDAHAGRTRNF